MSDPTHAELERLKRAHRCAKAALARLEQLPQRSPEDDLQLRAQRRLTCRLASRIQWMEAQLDAQQSLIAAAASTRSGAGSDPVRWY